jgi:hypothetical protein
LRGGRERLVLRAGAQEMKTAVRVLAFLILMAAGLAALRFGPGGLAAVIALGIASHAAIRTRARTAHFAAPVLLFALVLTTLQWLNGAVDIRLPLRTIAIFLLSTAAFRVLPWPYLIAGLDSRSPWYLPAMFLLFVRHFAAMLLEEVRRAFQARSLCVSANIRRGGFQSLVWATASVFRRAIDRAERFYAAQTIGGAQG